jgi:hypothetical protein
MIERVARWLMYLGAGLLLLVLLGALLNLMIWAVGVALLVVGLWLTWRASRRHPWVAVGLMVLAAVVLARMAIGLWWTLAPALLAAFVLWGLWAWWSRRRPITPPAPSGRVVRLEHPSHHPGRG